MQNLNDSIYFRTFAYVFYLYDNFTLQMLFSEIKEHILFFVRSNFFILVSVIGFIERLILKASKFLLIYN